MIFETLIDNLRDIMESKKKSLQYAGLMETSLQIMVRAITDYIIRTLVKTDETIFNQRNIQLAESFSGVLELTLLVKGDEEILNWLENKDNWRDCFLIYSDSSLLDADIFWSITKALCLIEDAIKNKLSFTSEVIISSLHHIIICFASLFDRQKLDPENLVMLLNHTTISVCYGKGNGNKPLKEWEQKEMLSKFFADNH